MNRQRDRIPTRELLTYCAPAGGIGFMAMLVSIYFLKFSTDVLLIAPATMGLLFGLSRFWDAVSDPLLGFLTDRTRSRWGRRRPWMFAGIVPMGAAFVMMWSPPPALEGGALTVWMLAAIVGFFTGLTMIDVPHAALGAEITDDYHERTRLFGTRRIVFGVGSLLAVAAITAFEALPDARLVGRIIGPIAAALGVVLTLYSVRHVRERPEFQGRGARRPIQAFRDVWHNRNARILILVFTSQQLGIVSLTVSIPFFAEYVLGTPEYTSLYIGAMLGSSILGVPLWIRFAPLREKRTSLLLAMVIAGLAIACLTIAPTGNVALVVAIASLGGLAAAGCDVLFPSLQADVIDWDELQSGERKEGAYFATWSFAAKTSGALASTLVGVTLGAMGFVPNTVQHPDVLLGMRVLAGLVPAGLWALGIVIFLRFDLGAAEHARILTELGRGSAAQAGEGTSSREPAVQPAPDVAEASVSDASETSIGTRVPSASKRASSV
jgi:GPH family glycoside/pentoside/hexuronide:cation symporter